MDRAHLSRRRLIAAGATGAAGTLIAACGGAKNQKPVSGSAAGQAPGAAKKGGILHTSYPGDIFPEQIPLRFSPPSNEFVTSIYDLLVAYDPKVNPVPKLATSWEWSPDFLQLTLKMRPNVTFHSGRAFTSEDGAFTIKRTQAPEVVSLYEQRGLLQ